jgi:hypothetical protein
VRIANAISLTLHGFHVSTEIASRVVGLERQNRVVVMSSRQ